MKKNDFRRIRRTLFTLSMIALLFAVFQTPTQVAAITETFSENFDDTTYLDDAATTATGWGHSEIRIPFKEATFVDNCSITQPSSYRQSVFDDRLYLPVAYQGVDVVDISTPTDPAHVTLIPATEPRYMTVQGSFGYLCDNVEGLRILNITDVTSPIEVATYNPAPAYHFTVDGSYGYLSTYGDGIHVLDISNPLAPVSVCNYTNINATYTLQTQKVGNVLFALEFGVPQSEFGVQIINATDPTDLNILSRLAAPSLYAGEEMHVSGDYIYVHSSETLSIISIETWIFAPELVAEIPVEWTTSIGMSVSGGYIYGVGTDYRLQMLDVSDLANPRLDSIEVTGGGGTFAWIIVLGNYVYSTSGYSFEVYELSNALTATAQSLTVVEAAYGTVITEATLTADATIPGSTSIAYYLSADYGDTWDQVTPGVVNNFTEYSRYLLWKSILTTTIATVTPEISSIDISFKILRVPPEITDISYTVSYNRPFFIFNQSEGVSILHLDTVPTFDSPNFLNYTTTSVSGAVTGYGILITGTTLENGTWYYRTAGVDAEDDIGLWSDVAELQIGTTTTGFQPDLILILVIGGVIGVVVVLIVVIQRKKST